MAVDPLAHILTAHRKLQRASTWLPAASRCLAAACTKVLLLLMAMQVSAFAVTVAATLTFPYRGLLETQVEQVQAFYLDWATAYPWAAERCPVSGFIWSPVTSAGYYDVYVCPDLGNWAQPLPVQSACPPSFTLDSGVGADTCTRPDDTPDLSKMAGKPCTCEGDPIDAGSGNSYQVETDYIGPGSFPLRAVRFYNSGPTVIANWGSNWRGFYDRAISLGSSGTLNTAYLRRHDGRVWAFNLVNGHWSPESDLVGTLTGNSTAGWTYTNADNETEKYASTGKLLSISDRSGRTQTLAYNGSGLLATVTDSFGRHLGFSYDSFFRVTGMTDPDGQTYKFQYSGQTVVDNLTTITYPDQKNRTYVYGESDKVSGASLPHALTGLVDENGDRFATWHYDAQGRAVSSENSVTVEKVSLTYNADGTTSVTDALGGGRSYHFQTVLGVTKSSSLIRNPDGATQQTVYDANGNIARRTDFNGTVTTYTYDLSRNLETSRTEASGTANARTITTTWHSSYRLPLVVAEPLRRTTYTYDSNGNQLSKTVQATSDATGAQGISAALNGTPRIWRHTYNSVGQILTSSGPRTDIVDLTSYAYDTMGNLISVTNALNQTTTLSQYDLNGRAGRIADSNGAVTDLSYSPRGWLTSKITTAGSTAETTSYSYDGVGQITKVTLADGAYIDYSYDDAHRLTGIVDSAGNSIAYTLDAMGNRTNEQVKDPGGQLARQTSRVIDALNRVQQITGPGSQ